jgi:mono/diheme cytochrome c family protein
MKSLLPLLAGTALAALPAAISLAQKPTASSPEYSRGRAVFETQCVACHGAGIGRPGTEALQRKYNGALPAVLTDRTDLSPVLVKAVVRNGISFMPRFRKTEISDADLDALSRYLSSPNK